MTRYLNETVSPVAPTITFLSNNATDRLQTGNFVGKVAVLLPVIPDLGKAIPDILHAILDPLVSKDTQEADLVKNLVPPVKTTWDDAASEDSSMGPSSAADLGAPVAGPNPPAGFLSQPLLPRGHAVRQVVTGAGAGNGSGVSSHDVPEPP